MVYCIKITYIGDFVMKKIVFILFAVTMLFTACNSEPSAKEDFLKVDLGMSTIELFDILGEPDTELPARTSNANLTIYWYDDRTAFDMQDVFLAFSVDENGIDTMGAVFHSSYSDNKSYLTEYETVKKKLISEWGKPIETIEKEDSFMNICSWGNKFLELYRREDNVVIFQVTAYRQDYLDSHPNVTEAWTTE